MLQSTSWILAGREPRRPVVRLVATAVLLLALGACATDPADESTDATSAAPAPGGVAVASDPAPTADAAPSAMPGAAGTTITTGTAEPYGAVLTDGTGMTLYVFFEDSGGRSMCYDACAENWPPLLTTGEPSGEGRADDGLVGALQRDDGSLQVTYDGQPLYLYSGDSEPGDVNGFGSGNVWYPVTPDGAPIDVASGGSEPAAGEY
jgi:predicted lipoprotein with Yx(FWY)xxD motif